METSIGMPDDLAKELEEFNEKHPERPINLSGVCRKALRDILDEAKGTHVKDCIKKFIGTTTNGFKIAPMYCVFVAVVGWVVLIAFKGGEYYLKSDWDAFGPISNILLVSVLVIVTCYYAGIQTKFIKIDRISKEMDRLVSPLNSMKDTALMFTFKSTNKVPKGDIRDNAYYEFWTGINQNKYLGPLYLRSAIDDYLLESNSDKPPIDEIEKKNIRKSVEDAAKKRYGKLDNEISMLAGGSTWDKVVAGVMTFVVFFVVYISKMMGWL